MIKVTQEKKSSYALEWLFYSATPTDSSIEHDFLATFSIWF